MPVADPVRGGLQVSGLTDALDREAQWLTAVDDLPNLNNVFEIIQARWPRTLQVKKRGLYVLHDSPAAHNQRTTNQHTMTTFGIQLMIVWPFKTTSAASPAETEQAGLDAAIDAVTARVFGELLDHTHGGRFLSVAEDPTRLTVDMSDAAQGVADFGWTARIRYTADDFETVN